jgi:hypothetical protein
MKWILLVFVLTLSLSAFAQNSGSWPLTGKQFLQDCKAIIEGRRPTPDEMWDTAFCAGFFQGVIEGHGAWLKQTKSKPMHLPCIPYDMPNKQFVKIVAKYINDNPDKLQLPAAFLIEKALSSAFPCK